MLRIPSSVGEVTPTFLTAALGSCSLLGGATVTSVEPEPIGTGQMCDSFRLRLGYDKATPAPQTVVVKLPSTDAGSRTAARALRCYEIEVRFYQELAGELPVPTPACYHAAIEVDSGEFVLLLADLAPAVQGDQMAGCALEEATVAIDALVALHAPRWGDPSLAELEWLGRDRAGTRAFLLELLPSSWAGFCDRYAAALDEAVFEVGAELFSSIESYLAGSDTAPPTIVHGDYRLDNLLFDAAAKTVAVVDWQTCGLGAGCSDLAYFLGAGLLPELRRQHEQALVRRYHDGLVAAGVTGYGFERCFADYRRGSFGGLVMAVAASMLVERTERGDEMFLTMARRHARHALDLDAASVL